MASTLFTGQLREEARRVSLCQILTIFFLINHSTAVERVRFLDEALQLGQSAGRLPELVTRFENFLLSLIKVRHFLVLRRELTLKALRQCWGRLVLKTTEYRGGTRCHIKHAILREVIVNGTLLAKLTLRTQTALVLAHAFVLRRRATL